MRYLSWAVASLAAGVLACGGGEQSSDAIQDEAPRIEGNALAAALADANVLLLDVRNPEELEELGTVEGYVNIPIDELADRLDELPKDKPILTA